MISSKNKNKTVAFIVLGLFVLTGTWNAVVINSESDISSEAKFVKRLDEVYGHTTKGREVAASVTWQKLAPVQEVSKSATPTKAQESVSTPEAFIPEASVKEELTLSLVEVINPAKWQNGLPSNQFTGSLFTNNGLIENLTVSLPDGAGVSVSFSEMAGNVFEYDLNGELYSGMMYQVDRNSYMVTLTNGPLDGTRLRFSTASPSEEQFAVQESLAQNNNVEVGTFGEAPTDNSQLVSEEMVQTDVVQAFDFNQTQAL
jgi:hypothetical protein